MEKGLFMKLKPYNSLEEILVDSRIVSKTHNGNQPVSWMPDRFKLLLILGENYTKKIIEISNNLKYADIKKIDMFPSEFIKAAHNLQLSAKQNFKSNKQDLINAYIKLVNFSIVRRQHLIKSFEKKLINGKVTINVLTDDERQKLLFLSALLRACSEIVFFDNHTSSSDSIGLINYNNYKVLIKSFNSIVPNYVFPNDNHPILFNKINIYLFYNEFDADFDMIGNYTSVKDVNLNLKKYSIEIYPLNGFPYYININEAEKIIQNYLKILKDYSFFLKHINENEAIECVLKCLIQVNKPLLDYLNYDCEKITEESLACIIAEYGKTNYTCTSEVFQSLDYDDAIETIINPKITINA